MKNRYRVLFFLGAFALAGCPLHPQPVLPEPEDPDASVPLNCTGACANLRAHHCSLAEPTPHGGTCEAVCENVRINNAGAGFPVVCLARAKTCATADRCN